MFTILTLVKTTPWTEDERKVLLKYLPTSGVYLPLVLAIQGEHTKDAVEQALLRLNPESTEEPIIPEFDLEVVEALPEGFTLWRKKKETQPAGVE